MSQFINEISAIRSKAASEGVYITAREAEEILKRLKAQNQTLPQNTKPLPQTPVSETIGPKMPATEPESAGAVENTLDFVGSTLWNALDSALLSAPGLLFKNVAPETFEDFEEELYDSFGGRAGSMVGGLAGFMVPYGQITAGTSALLRLSKTAQQAKKISKAGDLASKIKTAEAVVKPTTPIIQKTAALKFNKEFNRLSKGVTSKKLGEKESLEFIKTASDNIIGFQGGRKWSNIYSRMSKPAYQMEYSTDFVNAQKQILRSTLPNRIKTEFSRLGLRNLSDRNIAKLSDELVETLSKQGTNQIESTLYGIFGSGANAMAASRALGWAAQEMVNLTIIGTMYDFVGSMRGDISYDDKSFLERSLWHAGTGLVFGPIKGIPGGRGKPIWQDFAEMTGLRVKSINKKIDKMQPTEFAMYMKNQLKVNKGTMWTVRSGDARKTISAEDLRRGFIPKKQDLPSLKEQAKNFNKKTLSDFRRLAPMDITRDFVESIPRMALGSVAFNVENIFHGHWENLDHKDIVFQSLLGALMSKHYRPLYPGGAPKSGMHLGERKYYYNSELHEAHKNLEVIGLDVSHIYDSSALFRSGLQADIFTKAKSADSQIVKDILKENNVIYDATKSVIKESDQLGNKNNQNLELNILINDMMPTLQAEGFEMNPNATKLELKRALKQISETESQVLGSAETPVFLNKPSLVKKSNLISAGDELTYLNNKLYSSTVDQIKILTGDDTFVGENGRMQRIRLDKSIDRAGFESNEIEAVDLLFGNIQRFRKTGRFSQDQTTLEDEGYIVKVESLRGDRIKALVENKNALEAELSKEYYGNSGIFFDSSDQHLWQLFDNLEYERSVDGTLNALQGIESVKDLDQTAKNDIAEIKRLTNQIFMQEEGNLETITSDYRNIEIEMPEGNIDFRKESMLRDFVKEMWSIESSLGNSANGTNKKYTVESTKIERLIDLLAKQGMPHYLDNYHDSRLLKWIEKANINAMDRTLGALDVHPIEANAVRYLLMNGLVVTGGKNKNAVLEMPREITLDEIKNIPGANFSAAEKEAFVESYKNVVSALRKVKNEKGRELVNFVDSFVNKQLSIENLRAIQSIELSLNTQKLAKDIQSFNESNLIDIQTIRARITTLEDELKDVRKIDPNDSSIDFLKSVMDAQILQRNILEDAQKQFITSIAGKELTRMTAQIAHMKSFRKIGGSSFTELFKDVLNYDSANILKNKDINTVKGELETLSDRFDDMMKTIAYKVSKDPSVTTLNSSSIDSRIRSSKEMEVEGRTPESKNYINPDKFVQKYNIKKSDIINATGGVDVGDANKAIQNIYLTTVNVEKSDPSYKDKVNNYIKKMYKLAGHGNKARVSNDLIKDVVRLTSLVERQYAVKNLKVDVTSGRGTFENSHISKGFLTDTWAETVGHNADLVLLSDKFIENQVVKKMSNDGDLSVESVVNSNDFQATLANGAEHAISKQNKIVQSVDADTADLGVFGNSSDYVIGGRNTIIPIDENINILFPEKGFHSFAKSFIKWYDKSIADPYVKTSIKKYSDAADLFDNLKITYDRIKESSQKVEYEENGILSVRDEYTLSKFVEDVGHIDSIEGQKAFRERIFRAFSSMYGSKANKNWLLDAYDIVSSVSAPFKDYKYRRLAQNLGYKRNSDEVRIMVEEAYKNSGTEYYRDLVKRFSVDSHEFDYTLTIDDGNTTDAGEPLVDLITDVRSNAMQKLEDNKSNYNPKDYANMKKILENSHALGAEEVNASTIVRRDRLDFALLMDGRGDLIGNSSGQKPVGLSSYTDDNGFMHVFYNKTHYFYHSDFDQFFSQNPDIHMIAFKSGAKKSSIIDPNDPSLKNQFVPIGSKDSSVDIPKASSGVTLKDWINSLKGYKPGSEGVFPQKFNQSLAGTAYGKGKDAKYSRQLENYTSFEVGESLYNKSKQDAISAFAETQVMLFNPENTTAAIAEAQRMVAAEDNPDGFIRGEAENINIAHIGLEAGGIPFNAVLRSSYESYIKKKYIDQAGVFDGYTDAGGAPVLRGNFDNTLNIPIYRENKQGTNTQVKLGEFNASSQYLNKNIIFREMFGAVPKGKNLTVSKTEGKYSSDVTLSVDIGNRDLVISLATKEVYDPEGVIKNFESLPKNYKESLEKLRRGLAGTSKNKANFIQKWSDIALALRDDEYKGVHLVGNITPNPRTGPHDVVIAKLTKNAKLLNDADGGILELNNYDVTLRAQRDFDTDKVVFMFDNPFDFISENYLENGNYLEAQPALPENLKGLQLNMYDFTSFTNHNNNIRSYKALRGPIVKAHRVLTYLDRIFDNNSIKIGENEIVFDSNVAAKQRLINDSQNVLDVYNKFNSLLDKGTDWTLRNYYGNTEKKLKEPISVDVDKPFLYLKNKDGNIPLINAPERYIVDKLMKDFNKVLTVEGGIWEYGESKSARYKDMVSYYREFKETYHKDKVNWEFYHYVKAKTSKAEADRIFFNSDSKKIENGEILDIMGPVQRVIFKAPNDKIGPPTAFLKSLHKVASKNELATKKLYTIDKKSFDQQIMQYIGRNRKESLDNIIYEGINPDLRADYFDDQDSYYKNMWDAFNAKKDWQDNLIQANAVEQELRQLEANLNKMSRNKAEYDDDYLRLKTEEVQIKRDILNKMLDKTGLELAQGKYGKDILKEWKMKIINPSPNKEKKRILNPPKYGELSIVNEKTGTLINVLKNGDKPYYLRKGEVGIENRVKLTAISDADLVDGVAWFHSLGGEMASIRQEDMPNFQKYVRQVHIDISKALDTELSKKGLKDWSNYAVEAQKAIDNNLKKFLEDIVVADPSAEDNMSIFLGRNAKLPDYAVDYPKYFLIGSMISRPLSNPNEYYYMKKSGSLVPSVKKPNKFVVQAAFKAMENYKIIPDLERFIGDTFRKHAAFYDAFVAGRNFEQATNQLMTEDFTGALMNKTISQALHQPYVNKSEYEVFSQNIPNEAIADSKYAEYFRQVFQENAIIDPITSQQIRRRVIEDYGIDAYNDIFRKSIGNVAFDGTSSSRFGVNKGEGVMMMDIVMPNLERKEKLIGKKSYSTDSNVLQHVETVISRKNLEYTQSELEMDC